MKYESTLTIKKPPLLVAWLALELKDPLPEMALERLRESVASKLDYSYLEAHQHAKIIGVQVSRGLEIWTSENKNSVLGLSKCELYLVSAMPRFADLLKGANSVFSFLKDVDVEEVHEMRLNYYNVFESEGVTTDLLRPEFQGPPAEHDHEHRYFRLVREAIGNRYTTRSVFLHGNQYRPGIRDPKMRIEKYLSLAPAFKVEESVNCYGLTLTVLRNNVALQECTDHLCKFKKSIDGMFLDSITEKAMKAWEVQTNN